MTILAIESSALAASSAVLINDKLVSECFVCNKLNHSVTLLPLIDDTLRNAEITINDVDYIACANGPGSYTGLRIGAAMAKGLAMPKDNGRGIPIVAVNTLDTIAHNIISAPKEQIIIPIMDARREQVYTAGYIFDTELTLVTDYEAKPLADVLDFAEQYNSVLFLGDGVPVYRDIILKRLPNALFAPPNANLQRASSVAVVAFKHIKNNENIKDYKNFIPIYVREWRIES
jgi:tRNA threonylcarbamoyladenosine biosynthesis protein TsaB